MSTGERVDSLENALKELAYAGRKTEMGLEELKEQTAESGRRLDRMLKGMAEQNAETARENKRVFRESQKQWGDLANKMGSFVEDVVLPNFPRILKEYFAIEEIDIDDLYPRPKKRHPADRSRRKEFDLVAVTADTVFVNETKSDPTAREFRQFVHDDTSIFEYFPELKGRKLVKIASALYMAPEVVRYLTRHGCYAMMLGEETMELVNFKDIAGA